MRISDGILAMMVVSVLAVNSQGQIVTEMTPERIREAIEVGMRAKEVWPYRIKEKTHFSLRPSFPPQIAVFTTPFLRVALAASMARKQHQEFTETDVTAEMIAPEIQVCARSQPALAPSVIWLGSHRVTLISNFVQRDLGAAGRRHLIVALRIHKQLS